MIESMSDYFKSNEKNKIKSDIIFDIKNGKISRIQVSQIIYIIDSKYADYWENERIFTPKNKVEWNGEYLNWLSAGVFTGNFTPKYLMHFAEASEYVYNAKMRTKRIIIGSAVIVASLLVIALIAINS